MDRLFHQTMVVSTASTRAHRLCFAMVSCAVLTLSTRASADDPPNTPQPMPAPPENPTSAEAQDLPYRFRDMLRFEADRAREGRYFSGGVYTLTATAVVTAGALSLATADTKDPRIDALRAQAYVMISVGGVAVVGASVLTFIPTSAEQLEKNYSAYAGDERVPAAKRLYDGEEALRVMARKDMLSRRIVGASTIGIGVGLAALAVWRSTLTESSTTDRAISATLTAASSLATIGAGVGLLFFQRGPSEVALAHWEASQGRFRQASLPLRITPLLAPVRGGATAGMLLEL